MKVRIHSPYGATYNHEIISAGGATDVVHFDHGVAELDVVDLETDPRIHAFRGMGMRPSRLTYTVKVLDEPATVTA